MANENEVIPILSEDESDYDEMLEIIHQEEEDNDGSGGNGRQCQEPSLEQQLASFRQEWHRELGQGVKEEEPPHPKSGLSAQVQRKKGVSPSREPERINIAPPQLQPAEESDVEIASSTETVEDKAKYLFRQGVWHERNGRMYEAVLFYKQAIQLVPDVEARVQESEGNSHTGSTQASDDEENNNEVAKIITKDPVDNQIEELSVKLQSLTTNDLRIACHPKTPQTATHVSALPLEVLLYILRWVVTPDLDLRSLEQVSMVCRGFYVCSRDSGIWRKACIRMWGNEAYLQKEYVSWRHMYVERPHPHFNGLYLSRTTYVRQGEPSIDQFYKPWHLVEYHRFLRVFSDGTILLASSAEDPQSIVSKMHRNYSIPGKLVGRYRIVGDMLTAVLEKENVKEADSGRRYMRHRGPQPPPESEQTFHMELRICRFGHRPSMKLEWNRYACHTTYRSTGNVNVIDFDMSHQFFPFYFSRVKSYARTSEAPL